MGPRWQRWMGRAGRSLRRDTDELHALATQQSERDGFLASLRRPSRMRQGRKHVLVFLAFLVAAATWAVGTAVLRALAPGAARSWDLAWGLAAWGFLTTVALPLPFEPALFAARSTSGEVVAVLASASGKTLGAAVVFFLGGAIRSKLEGWKDRHAWLRGFLETTEDAAKRWKAPALAVMMAIPLFPDSLPVYLFSVLRLRLRSFLLASFVGVAFRSTLVLLLGRAALL